MAHSKFLLGCLSLILAAASANANPNPNPLTARDDPFACHQGSPLVDGDLNAFASCTCNDGSTYPTLPPTAGASCGYTAAPAPTLISVVTIDAMTITPMMIMAGSVASSTTAMTTTRTTTISGQQAVYTDILSQGSSAFVLDGVTVELDAVSTSAVVNGTSTTAGSSSSVSGAPVTTSPGNSTALSTTLRLSASTSTSTPSATGKSNGASHGRVTSGAGMAMVVAIVGACLLYPALG